MKKNIMFDNISTDAFVSDSSRATYMGVTRKTVFLLLIVIAVGAFTAYQFPHITDYSGFITMLIASSIIGFICVVIGRSSAKAAKICSIIYSVCEGLFLGAFTLLANYYVDGVGYIASFVTMSIFGVMLFLYSSGIVKATSRLKKIFIALFITALITAIFLPILQFFNPNLVSFEILILTSALFLLFGTISLVFKFDEAQNLVDGGFEKEYEWQVSFGLLITVIYIYVEVIRLILIIASKKD